MLSGEVRGRRNRKDRIRFAVLVEDDRYVVCEYLAGDDPEVGDRITGIPETRGHHTITNETRNRSVRVIIEGVGVSRDEAHRLLLAR